MLLLALLLKACTLSAGIKSNVPRILVNELIEYDDTPVLTQEYDNEMQGAWCQSQVAHPAK